MNASLLVHPRSAMRATALPAIAPEYLLSLGHLLAALVTSAITVFNIGVYDGAAGTLGSAQGTSLVVLVVGLPLLLGSMVLAAKGSLRARIVWTGTLAFMLYNAVVFAFAMPFNRLFPLQVAVLSLALWSLVVNLIGWRGEVGRLHASRSMPVRGLAIYLVATAVLSAALWLSQLVPALWNNTLPVGIKDAGMPTNPFHVIDFALTIPLLLLATRGIRAGRPWGFALSGALMAMLLVESVSVATDQVFAHRHDPESSLADVPIFAVLAVVGLAAAVVFLRYVSDQPGRQTPRSCGKGRCGRQGATTRRAAGIPWKIPVASSFPTAVITNGDWVFLSRDIFR